MTDRHRNYLLLEQGIGAGVVNFFINLAIAWGLFRGLSYVPLWGDQSIAGDTLGTTFFLPFLTTLFVTRLARGHMRAGRVPPLSGMRDRTPLLGRLPQGTMSRGLLLGALGTIFVGIPTVLVLRAVGVAEMSFGGFLWFKSLFAAVLGALVTPVIALYAITYADA